MARLHVERGAATYGADELPSKLHDAAARFDDASQHLERGEPRWTFDRETENVALTVSARGRGDLDVAALWAFEELVYWFPEHVDNLMSKKVPLDEIEGAKKKKAVLDAVARGGIEAVALLRGVTLTEETRGALEARQDAGLGWVRAHYPELANIRGKIAVVSK